MKGIWLLKLTGRGGRPWVLRERVTIRGTTKTYLKNPSKFQKIIAHLKKVFRIHPSRETVSLNLWDRKRHERYSIWLLKLTGGGAWVLRERVTIRGMGDERGGWLLRCARVGGGGKSFLAAGLAGCQVRRSYNLYTHTHTLTHSVWGATGGWEGDCDCEWEINIYFNKEIHTAGTPWLNPAQGWLTNFSLDDILNCFSILSNALSEFILWMTHPSTETLPRHLSQRQNYYICKNYFAYVFSQKFIIAESPYFTFCGLF